MVSTFFTLRSSGFRNSDKSSQSSDITEAQMLVQRCAEPRPVGDSVKAAINRAAKRLGFDPSRTRKLWYGDARIIAAHEMDWLRKRAVIAEVDRAVDDLNDLRAHLSKTGTPDSQEVITGIDAALRALGRGPDVGD